MTNWKNQALPFKFAWAGIRKAIGKERNLRVHICMAILALLAGFGLQVDFFKMAILLCVIGLVFCLELMNTAIEAIIDLVSPEYHPLAGYVKDVAAGAVLVAAIIAMGVGLLILLPPLLRLLGII